MMAKEEKQIELTSAYTVLGENLNPDRVPREIHEVVRIVRGDIDTYYIFDKDNEERLNLLEKQRIETKELERALRSEFKRRGLPIWTKRGKKAEYAKKYRRMSFLIRPPYTSSFSEYKDRGQRQEYTPGSDVFYLHFDKSGTFQTSRFYLGLDGVESHALYKSHVRSDISKELKKNADKLTKAYGDFREMARIIADIFESPTINIRQYIRLLDTLDNVSVDT